MVAGGECRPASNRAAAMASNSPRLGGANFIYRATSSMTASNRVEIGMQPRLKRPALLPAPRGGRAITNQSCDQLDIRISYFIFLIFRPTNMHELSKSIQRRLHDANFVTRYFRGDGIDIGAGPDPLGHYIELFPLISSLRAWDIKDGDAELMTSCADEQFDFVHSSHCLEHMRNADVALKNWFRILRPGGHLIVIVPDEDMYEQGIFPSTFNTDHKWTFTVFKTSSWSNSSRNLLELIMSLGERADLIKLEQ